MTEKTEKQIHPSHEMGEWEHTVVTIYSTSRYGKLRKCKKCEAEEAETIAGKAQHPELFWECGMTEVQASTHLLGNENEVLRAKIKDLELELQTGEPHVDGHPLYSGLPNGEEAVKLHARRAVKDVVRAVLNLFDIEGCDFYYNKANGYGSISFKYYSGEGDPWDLYRGEELTAKYGNGEVKGTGYYRGNDLLVENIAKKLEFKNENNL